MPDLKNFKFTENFIDIIKEGIKTRIFSILTKKSQNLFIRGGDVLSIYSQTRGNYEASLIKIINQISDDYHHRDFFDIGANIGLVSCQCGHKFKEIHLFEPNLDCFKILDVNLNLTQKKFKKYLYNFGLGKVNKKVKLYVPLKNWGGAFVFDENNAYDKKILANKDGYKIFQKNYTQKNIQIKSTKEVFKSIMKKLVKKNLYKGVIKIDVEGYELIILKELAKCLHDKIELFVIFENHKHDLNLKNIAKSFKRDVKVFKIYKNTPWKEHWPSILKGISILFQGKINTKIIDLENKDATGNIIMHIK